MRAAEIYSIGLVDDERTLTAEVRSHAARRLANSRASVRPCGMVYRG